MNKKTIKILALALALVIGSVAFVGISRFDNTCDELRDNILRLHILANSDSEVDQAVKLRVRDAVLAECQNLLGGCQNINEAVETARINSDKFQSAANEVLKSEGVSYSAQVCVKNENYTTRIYDKFTLPAGEYNSVVVSLGDAEGKNWWCIMYPSVCLSAAGDLNSVSNESNDVAVDQEKYIIRFWIVELYEKITNMFEK